jgi:hypothetical protein
MNLGTLLIKMKKYSILKKFNKFVINNQKGLLNLIINFFQNNPSLRGGNADEAILLKKPSPFGRGKGEGKNC